MRSGSRWLALAGAGGLAVAGLAAPVGGQPVPATGSVMTVRGPVSPDTLGLTLAHEHLFIDFTVPSETPEGWAAARRARPTGATAVKLYQAPLTMDILGAVSLGAPNRDNWLLTDERLAVDEAMEFVRHGGRTIVDVTSIGLKRDPAALARVAQATGLNIVMGAGWYEPAWAGADTASRSVESLTDEIVRDLTVGVGATGIRSGIIGEIGTLDPDSPGERRVIEAAARASQATGAAISIHIAKGRRTQAAVMDILAAAGADLTRVAMGHSNPIATDRQRLLDIVSRGAYAQFDLLGDPPHVRMEVSDHDVATAIVDLIRAGHADRILLSQDVCTKRDLKAYGGSGYSFVPEYFLPYLKRLGVTDAEIRTIVVDNPKRLLTLAAPRAPRAGRTM